MNQVQLDLSGYRTKARSTYESTYVPAPVEAISQSYSPALKKNVSFGSNSNSPDIGNGSLVYSPTPREPKL